MQADTGRLLLFDVCAFDTYLFVTWFTGKKTRHVVKRCILWVQFTIRRSHAKV